MYLNLGCGNTFHKNWVNIDFASDSPSVKIHDLSKGIPYDDNSFKLVYHSHVLEHFNQIDAINFLKECYRVTENDGVIRIVIPDLKEAVDEYVEAYKNVKENKNELTIANYQWAVIELIDQFVREESGGEMLRYWAKDNIINSKKLESRVGTTFYKFKNYKFPEINPPKGFNQKVKAFILSKIGISWEQYQAIKFYSIGERHKWMYDDFSLVELLNEIGYTKITIRDGETSYIEDWKEYMSLDQEGKSLRIPNSLIIEGIKK